MVHVPQASAPQPRPSVALRLGILVALLGSVATANTDQAQSTLGVSATVVAVARIELLGNEPELLVTADDLHRGYVEAADLLQLTVYSNSRSGYVLEVLPKSSLFAGVAVQGFGGDIRLPSGGGTITQRWGHPQKVSLALKFRFELAEGVQPGRYPWPVRLAARPLS